MATFYLNPYNGNIDQSTNAGLKLLLKLTEGHKEDAKLKLSQLNVKNLMSAFESDARKFRWCALVNVVMSNGTGQYNKFILKIFSEVNVGMVKKQARTTWGDRAAVFGDNLP